MPREKNPIKILNEKVVAFDCDGTLVLWEEDISYWPKGAIFFPNPYYSPSPYTGTRGAGEYLVPHKKHIQKLKSYSKNGYFVIVWSMGGGPWAQSVVDTLELNEYVDLIMPKPNICYDDMSIGNAFGERKFYKDKENK